MTFDGLAYQLLEARPSKREIARRVRKEIELWIDKAQDVEELEDDEDRWLKPSPSLWRGVELDPMLEPMRELADVDPEDLSGLCAIASEALARSLRAYGYPAKVMKGEWCRGGGDSEDDIGSGECHCWVVSGKDRIDITATQYERRGIGRYPRIHMTTLDKGSRTYKRGETVPSLQDYYDWPGEQTPDPDLLKLLIQRPKRFGQKF